MSPEQMSLNYFSQINQEPKSLPAWYFCDNQKDADECAELVLNGVKRATSPALRWHEATNEPLAKPGDLNIVTDWAGNAMCIIETTHVEIVPFNQINADYAYLEGEGDKSLDYWMKVHKAYYQREAAEVGYTVTEDMPIVCETFKVVFPV